MLIIGCDYHPAFQQCRAFLAHRRGFHDTLPTASTCSRAADLKMLCICGHRHRRLEHREGAEKFYRYLVAQEKKVRVGMEASGHARWFERLLSELQFELWIGDAAEISSRRVRKQKTDRQDAQLILKLLIGKWRSVRRRGSCRRILGWVG